MCALFECSHTLSRVYDQVYCTMSFPAMLHKIIKAQSKGYKQVQHFHRNAQKKSQINKTWKQLWNHHAEIQTDCKRPSHPQCDVSRGPLSQIGSMASRCAQLCGSMFYEQQDEMVVWLGREGAGGGPVVITGKPCCSVSGPNTPVCLLLDPNEKPFNIWLAFNVTLWEWVWSGDFY